MPISPASPRLAACGGGRPCPPLACLAAAALAAAAGACTAGAPHTRGQPAPGAVSSAHRIDPARRPNILLIYTDDQGHADLGVFGGEIPTPHLDRLARRGVRFTDYYAPAPVCTPSRYGLLTGAYPARSRRGLERVLMPPDRGHLDPSEVTIAARLARAGYRTGLVGKWHLGKAREHGPTRHGFSSFTGLRGGAIDYVTYRYIDDPDWFVDDEPAAGEGYATDALTRHAISFIDADRGRPFFLYLAYTAPHYGKSATPLPPDTLGPAPNTLQAPGVWLERMAHVEDPRRRFYAAMVASLDENIGKLVAHLEARGLMEDTLVFFASDNGGDERYGASNAPLRGQKHQVLEGGIRVPAFMVWPGRIPAGAVSAQVACAIDVPPTLAAITGVALDGEHPVDGVDLGPALFEGRTFPRELYFKHQASVALRRGKWKLRDGALHDLASDPREEVDVGAANAPVLSALSARLAAIEQAIAERRPVPDRP